MRFSIGSNFESSYPNLVKYLLEIQWFLLSINPLFLDEVKTYFFLFFVRLLDGRIKVVLLTRRDPGDLDDSL